jgi:3-hydroxyisobutyrate dehydrogenase-like beta-hydroxyacid dehydrogenase
MKLLGNSMILGCIEVLAESFTLAEKSGIGAANLQELAKGRPKQHHYSSLLKL